MVRWSGIPKKNKVKSYDILGGGWGYVKSGFLHAIELNSEFWSKSINIMAYVPHRPLLTCDFRS